MGTIVKPPVVSIDIASIVDMNNGVRPTQKVHPFRIDVSRHGESPHSKGWICHRDSDRNDS